MTLYLLLYVAGLLLFLWLWRGLFRLNRRADQMIARYLGDRPAIDAMEAEWSDVGQKERVEPRWRA